MWEFSKMKLEGILFNQSKLFVKNEVKGLDKVIRNESQAKFETTCAPNAFEVSLDLRASGNWAYFSRMGHQALPKLVGNTFRNISISNRGNFEFPMEVFGADSLVVSGIAKVEVSNLKSNKQQLVLLATDTSKIMLIKPMTLSSDTIFAHFQRVRFQSESELDIERAGKVWIGRNVGLNHLNISSTDSLTLFFLADATLLNSLKINGDCKVDLQAQSLFLKGDCVGSGQLIARNATVSYVGSEKQIIKETDYHVLSVINFSKDTLQFFGSYSIDSLVVEQGILQVGSLHLGHVLIQPGASLLVGASSPKVLGSFINKGITTIFSDHAYVDFQEGVRNYGVFENNSLADHRIGKEVFNEGTFKGCAGTGCTWQIEGDFAFSGPGLIAIPRLHCQFACTVTNEGDLSISSSTVGNAVLNNKGNLSLGMSADQFAWELDAATKGNTVKFNRKGDQKVLQALNGHYYNLRISDAGEKTLQGNTKIEHDLRIESQAIFNQDTHLITGNADGKFAMADSTVLKIGNPLADVSPTFPVGFSRSNIDLAPFSTIVYSAWKDQEVSLEPVYGNLVFTDGIGSGHKRFLSPQHHDTLVVRGNLHVSESSIDFYVMDKNVVLKGDLLGVGSIRMTTGTFILEGNGYHDGPFEAGQSLFIYKGGNDQVAKRGTYHQIRVDKPSLAKVKVRAGSGIFEVGEELSVNSGILDFEGEQVAVNRLINKGYVKFTSRRQAKRFNEIDNLLGGEIDNSYGEAIEVFQSVYNEGRFISAGPLIFTGSSNRRGFLENKGLMQLEQLWMKRYDEFRLMGSLLVADTLKIDSTNLRLSESIVDFGSSGFLTGESNVNKIDGDSVSFFIRQTQTKSGLNHNIGGLGVDLFLTKDTGDVSVKRMPYRSTLNLSGTGIGNQFQIESLSNISLDGELRLKYYPYQLKGIKEEMLVGHYTRLGFNTPYFLVSSHVDTLNNQVSFDEISKDGFYSLGKFLSTPLVTETVRFWFEEESGLNPILRWCLSEEALIKKYRIIGVRRHQIDTILSVEQTGSGCYLHELRNYEDYQELYLWAERLDGEVARLGMISIQRRRDDSLVALLGQTFYLKQFPDFGIEVFSIDGKLIRRYEELSDLANPSDLRSGLLYLVVFHFKQKTTVRKVMLKSGAIGFEIR